MKRSPFVIASLICTLFLYSSSLVLSQVNPQALLKEAKELNRTAIQSGAKIFSESEFNDAAESLKDGEETVLDASKTESTIEKLNEAITGFKAAIANAKTLSASFSQLLGTRNLVLSLGMDPSLLQSWKDAEENFASAVDEYKDKDPEGVKKYSDLAEKFYRESELALLKYKYHGTLISEITKAEDKDLKKFAPLTLNKVKESAKDIESILEGNRYDTLKAKAASEKAFYELRHGLYMQRVFTRMKDEEKAFEDLQLMWEEPLSKIATEYKLPITLDSPPENLTSSILKNINKDRSEIASLSKENETLKKSLAETSKSLTEAQTENQKLTSELAGLKLTAEELKKANDEISSKISSMEGEYNKYKTQSTEQEQNQKLVDNVSSMFLPSEAEVIRNGDLLTIRLVNMNFPVNQSSIDPQYFNLLNKVQKSIQNFPNGSVVIEGHTDGQGSYQKNLDISQARANALLQYLMSTMGSDSRRISAIGLGSTKPIANNNTEEGRAKNRRIEIVINPNFTITK